MWRRCSNVGGGAWVEELYFRDLLPCCLPCSVQLVGAEAMLLLVMLWMLLEYVGPLIHQKQINQRFSLWVFI